MIINSYRFEPAAGGLPGGLLIDYDPMSGRYTGAANNAEIAGLDSSGNANDSGFGNVSYKPRYDSVFKCNGLNTFKFPNDPNGSVLNTYFWTLPNLSALTSGEAFAVFYLNYDPTTANELGSGLWAFGGGGTANVVPYKDGKIYDDFGSTTRQNFSSGGNANFKNQWILYSVKSVAGSQKAYYENTLLNNYTSNTVGFPSVPRLGMSWINYYYLAGWIARFLFFTPALSDANSLAVRDLLISTYSL